MTGGPVPASCDVLVPTRDRPGALAVTLAGLAGQSAPPTRVIVADQSSRPARDDPLVAAMVRVLEQHGARVEIHERATRRGMAEQRSFLLEQSTAATVLTLDDDVWLEPWALATMQRALQDLGCGFVGMAVQGLSYRSDRRPHELASYEPWTGPVTPETVLPGEPAWQRHTLHNAANLVHLAADVGATPQQWVPYRVAWIGGCALFSRAALESVGGYSFWPQLPTVHSGEDVLTQLRVIRRYGAAGILPSGAVHLELPTTVADRSHEAYRLIRP